jgi:hypothetical protein
MDNNYLEIEMATTYKASETILATLETLIEQNHSTLFTGINQTTRGLRAGNLSVLGVSLLIHPTQSSHTLTAT